MPGLNYRKAIGDAVRELEQALYMHERWAEDIALSLVCHVKPADREVKPNAHRLCRFGHWYYSTCNEMLRSQPGFAEVESEHRIMHEYAAGLLRASTEGRPITPREYQRFLSAMKSTRAEIHKLKHQLEISLYNIDPLTGIRGRAEMLREIQEQQEFVSRGVHECAVAMLDVDHFKAVNDTYGHSVGDDVLVDICTYVQANLRAYDTVFRYGGEEFLICLPDTGAGEGYDICDRLREGLRSVKHHTSAGKDIPVTVSIGLTVLDPTVSVRDAIERADHALLSAKNAGRNRTVIWENALLAA